MNGTRELPAISPRSIRPLVSGVAEHVRAIQGPDGGTVLDILNGKMFRLNVVGSRILEFVKQGKTELEIAQTLAGDYGIDQTQAEADLREFLQSLEKLHLLNVKDGNILP